MLHIITKFPLSVLCAPRKILQISQCLLAMVQCDDTLRKACSALFEPDSLDKLCPFSLGKRQSGESSPHLQCSLKCSRSNKNLILLNCKQASRQVGTN